MTYFIASSSSLPADSHALRRTASQEIDSSAPEISAAPVLTLSRPGQAGSERGKPDLDRAGRVETGDPVRTGTGRLVLAAGDGQGRPYADHGQTAGATDQLEPPRGAGKPGAGGARRECPGAVTDHRDG